MLSSLQKSVEVNMKLESYLINIFYINFRNLGTRKTIYKFNVPVG